MQVGQAHVSALALATFCLNLGDFCLQATSDLEKQAAALEQKYTAAKETAASQASERSETQQQILQDEQQIEASGEDKKERIMTVSKHLVIFAESFCFLCEQVG